ncbi:transposase [Massilia sp. DWR3-1-1]|uniref:transposase n=1 Tax=Massilia sp. DWR3-1-1 TaxID=2804559 RepID=UPI003CF21573
MSINALGDLAATVYLIGCHGDRRAAIFHDDTDRRNWLGVLAHVCLRHRWRVYAFCQMGNHYQLVAAPLAASWRGGIHELNKVYSQRFNARHRSPGQRWQVRLQGQCLHDPAQVLELARHVVLEPVRAGLVATPGGWPWSSYAMTCDPALAPPWLATESILGRFAATHADAVAAYRRFVADGCGSRASTPALTVAAAEK